MTTTTTPISLNGPSSNIRWTITGAVVGSVLTLGTVPTITVSVTLLITCYKRKVRREQQKWQQANTSNGENVQDVTLLAPYHLVNGSIAIDDNLWQAVSGKESGDTQGVESTLNKVCSETADSATIQLTQNAAYQRWRSKCDNVRGTTDDHDSGYVILDPALDDNQTEWHSRKYSNSITDDYDYI